MAEHDVKEPSGLARTGRRASISMPGLDLLTQIAEYTWQNKPQVNSSFDDLTEAGLASKYRGSGQIADKIRRGEYDAIQSGSENDIDYMDRSQSDVSEVDSPSLQVKVVGNKRTRKVNMFVENVIDDDAEINAEIQPLKPLATRRKSGVVPIKIPNSNFLKSDPIDSACSSPTPSTASMASMATLIRDKFSNSIPGVFRNKKPQEYKIQAFVAILFLIIILLVGSIYVIHKEKELQKSYFERIRFSSKDRKIRVADLKGREVLTGQLGMSLTKKDKAWPCLPQDRRVNETCLEWMNKARLYFSVKTLPSSSSEKKNNLRCYNVLWESLNAEFELKDCFNIDEGRGGQFYGGGEMNMWPLNRTVIPLSPFLTGNKRSYNGATLTEDDSFHSFQFGSSLSKYFVNSHGAAIQITDDTPLHISINHPKDRMLCLAAKNGFGYTQRTSGDLPRLNYTICTADNILDITSHLADKKIRDMKHQDFQWTLSMAQTPIWRILPKILLSQGNQSEAAFLNHTDRIAAALHLSEGSGFILIDESWQKRIGDLEMDSRRFPTMAETFNITRRRGFKVALTISPFFSTESKNYIEGLNTNASYKNFAGHGIWTAEKTNGRTSKTKVPALTQYKEHTSCAVLDVTNDHARSWLQKKVADLEKNYGIDALYVEVGNAYDFPQHYEFSNTLYSLDSYKELFLNAIRPLATINTIGVSGAIKLPRLPTFVALSPTESSWEGLQTIIPNILSLGVAGYPFLIPGSIGGDYFKEEKSNLSLGEKAAFRNDNNQTENPIEEETTKRNQQETSDSVVDSTSSLPDRELYIRWLELVHFLPVVQYSYLPSDYGKDVVEIATAMNNIRKNKLNPYIKKAIDAALTSGLPVIRPLWMIDPTDPNCLKVSDEFSIGGDIIVAPILRQGATERDIYLPRGKWRDEIDGSSTKGEKWLHHKKIKSDQIAFFTKISDVGPL